MKKIVYALALVAAFFVGACSPVQAEAEQKYPLKIWKQNENGKYETACVVDEETGVNYVVVSLEQYGKAASIDITPRMNADGTLYVE